MPTGKGAARAFAIATQACKKRGMTDFSAGSSGDKCRSRVAEGVARKKRKR
jgi:hypothetical protein